MHHALLDVAHQYGTPLSSRHTYGAYFWDGKTLACNQKFVDEDVHGVEHIIIQEHDDFTLAHEIAHWVVADPVEREFPEYGCQVLGGGLDFSTTKKNPTAYKVMLSIAEGVLTREEQDLREACADFLGCYWCDKFAIPIVYPWHALNKYTNSQMEYNHKTGNGYSQEMGWRAIIWLREHNLIP